MNEVKTYDEALRLLRYDFRRWREPHEQSVLYSILFISLLASCLIAAGFSGYHFYQGSLDASDALQAFVHLSLYIPLGIVSLVIFMAGASIALTRDLGKWRFLSLVPFILVALIQIPLYLLAPDIYRHLL